MGAPPDRPHVDSSTFLAGMRVLGTGIRMRPREFAVAVAGGLLYGGMTVAAAEVIGQVTERVVLPAFAQGGASGGALLGATAAIIGVAVAKAIGIIGRRVGGSWMQLSLHADTRRLLTDRYLALPVEWHRRHPTGTLLSTANADVEATWSPVAPLPMSLGVAFMLLVTGVVLVATDPWLAAVGFVVGPAIGVLNWRYTRAYRIPAREAQQRRGTVSAIAHESFDGAVVVKTLGLEAAETERFGAESDRLRDDLVRLGRMRAVFDPLLDMLPQLGILAVLLVGAHRAAAGHIGPAEVVEFAYLFSLLALPLRIIGYLLGELPRSVVGWERIQRVLRADEDVAFGATTPADTGRAAAVATDAVSYTHPGADEPALHDVTVDVPAGRVVAVVGPTGSGKSTLAGLLVRLVDPDDGRVVLDGVDLRAAAEGGVAQRVALVFQEAFIFDDTVRGNVDLDDAADEEEIWASLRLAHAEDFVRALPDGLDTRLGERGTTLSGGQRQRLALARALVRRPALLVLDDATSAVDVDVEAAILASLRDADLAATVLLIAHRRATIELADEVLFVAGGRLAARGPHTRLLAEVPAYAALLRAYEVTP